jgi:hypothetical protein
MASHGAKDDRSGASSRSEGLQEDTTDKKNGGDLANGEVEGFRHEKIRLNLARDYAKDWTVPESFREYIQNLLVISHN